MNLKVNKWKKIIKYLGWAIVVVLLAIFVIRVSCFEYQYLNEKEGSERAVKDDEDKPEELVEVKPTETEVYEYIVAPDRPRYLTIEKLGVYKARILPMSVNSAGELETPYNIFDVGWYVDSGKPGFGGTMLIDGHNGGPHVHGVFKELPILSNGDIITVERGDGEIFRYSVVENRPISLSESDAYMAIAMKTPELGKESISLISCTGEWSDLQQTYLSRQFTRAILVD